MQPNLMAMVGKRLIGCLQLRVLYAAHFVEPVMHHALKRQVRCQPAFLNKIPDKIAASFQRIAVLHEPVILFKCKFAKSRIAELRKSNISTARSNSDVLPAPSAVSTFSDL